MYPSGCAVGRCLPTFSMKTDGSFTEENVTVEFLVEEGDGMVALEMGEEDLNLLQDSCCGIQLTARY